MQIKYFQDTDTLLINFNANSISETKEINENMIVELDQKGNVVIMTLEQAKSNTDLMDFSFQQFVGA